MTTPTTGTAPLIERLANDLAEIAHAWFYDLDDAIPNLRMRFLAALGPDVLVIESREQARERIRAVTDDLSDRDWWYRADECVERIIAALAGEERP